MNKRYWITAVVICVLAVMLSSSIALAAEQAAVEDYRVKQTELWGRKNRVVKEYNVELDRITKEGDQEIAVIKKEFHSKRDACLQKMNNAKDALNQEYDAKMKPILEEERQLAEIVGQDTSNFAKPKALREKDRRP